MAQPKTRFAKQLFLHGLPNEGRPIVSVSRLAKLADCHEDTIRAHLPAWEKERDALIENSGPNGLTLRVSTADLERHKSDIEFLRERMEGTLSQIRKLPEAINRLASFIEEFNADASTEERSNALSALNTYVSGVGALKSLDAHFLTLQKRWVELNGISDMQSVGTSRDKAMAIAQSKLEASKAFAERQAAREPRKISGFARAADEIDGLD